MTDAECTCPQIGGSRVGTLDACPQHGAHLGEGLPVQAMMVAEDLLLVDAFKVAIGAGGKIGEEFGDAGPLYFITMEGRVNKSEERRSINVMLNAKFGYDLIAQMMSQLEALMEKVKANTD